MWVSAQAWTRGSRSTWRIRKPRVPPTSRDIPVYTSGMKIVKVRRVGNSNVVSIPRELESHGYTPGTSVLVEELRGELRMLPTEQLRRGFARSASAWSPSTPRR